MNNRIDCQHSMVGIGRRGFPIGCTLSMTLFTLEQNFLHSIQFQFHSIYFQFNSVIKISYIVEYNNIMIGLRRIPSRNQFHNVSMKLTTDYQMLHI